MSPSVLAGDTWRVGVDDAVAALAASPHGRIAVAGAEGSVTILAADGVIESRREVSLGCLTVAWSPAGDRVAVGSVHGVDVLDASGAVIGGRHGGWCASVAWSFDGSRLAAGVGRSTVVLDSSGTELFSAQQSSTVTGVAWVNRRVASAAYGGVHIHPVTRGSAPDVLPFTGSLLTLAVSPDRKWAASGNQDATLHVWRIGRRGDELSMSGYPTKITALAYSPDSALLASGGGADVTVWDFTGRGPRGSTPRILRGHDAVVTAIAWSADGDLLAAASEDGRAAVWSPRAAIPGHPLAPLDSLNRESPATAVGWDATGRLLAGWADATVAAHVVDRS
ncbi:WD40 repeat domain-containing protein [Mycobacterium sp. LTG2003]